MLSPVVKARKIDKNSISFFHKQMIFWFNKNSRNFPWRTTQDPYKILISEILLQKTNSRAVGKVYEAFIRKFPTPQHVVKSSSTELIKIVSPIGLKYRAERIYNICQTLVIDYAGEIPNDINALMDLRGVGRYIASALLCFGYGEDVAILDQNVIRILSRVFEINSNKSRPHTDQNLWLTAENLLPEKNVRDYNLALLDFSAKVCKPIPMCEICPIIKICCYYKDQ